MPNHDTKISEFPKLDCTKLIFALAHNAGVKELELVSSGEKLSMKDLEFDEHGWPIVK